MSKSQFHKLMSEEFPFFIGVPAFVWQVFFFYVPLCFIIFLSLTSYEYFASFITPLYAKIIMRSLTLATLTACTCFVIAYPLAYFIARQGAWIKNILLFLLIVPFWTNFLLHILAWFFVLEPRGFLNSFLLKCGIISQPLHLLNGFFAVSLMLIYYYLPFMVLPIYSSLEKFDARFIEASLDLGATWWQTLRRVIMPITLPGIRAGFFLVFVPAFGEFAIPELLGGDKVWFVGTVVSQYMLGMSTVSLGAAFTLISCCALIAAVVLLNWLLTLVIMPKR